MRSRSTKADAVMVPARHPSASSRRLAVLSQLSFLALQLILPAIIWATAGRRDAFVRGWASESLRLQAPWIGTFLVLSGMVLRTQSLIVVIIDLTFFEVVGIYGLACGIIGARKAWRGERWCYPINLRLGGRTERAS